MHSVGEVAEGAWASPKHWTLLSGQRGLRKEELSWAQAPSGQPSRPLRANDNKENKTVKHRIQESSLQARVRVGGEQPLLTALL